MIDKDRLKRRDVFGQALFDIEHALPMYALSYCTIPAQAIYDEQALKPLMSVIESCHVYLIGYTPIISFTNARQKDRQLQVTLAVLGKDYILSYDLPNNASLKQDGELWYLDDGSGQRYWPTEIAMQAKLSSEAAVVTFEVKYIGQAYGTDGSRNALDRLLKHETLQKIALKGVPAGYQLNLLMLAVQPNNQLITIMNPFAKNKSDGSARINMGLDKLFNTTEQERVSLYEAALIRYFYPEFNKEFKDSFPSTNLKILQDCYKKDFSAVIAEICIDELPFRLFQKTLRQLSHILQNTIYTKATIGRCSLGSSAQLPARLDPSKRDHAAAELADVSVRRNLFGLQPLRKSREGPASCSSTYASTRLRPSAFFAARDRAWRSLSDRGPVRGSS